MKNKVSIIIPIYNVEKYIERCVVSLFEQNFEDIEYIFVNDCTPDNSVEILQKVIEKYPNRKPQCKIIHHEENKGSGATRKIGIENATGEYTIQIDSDDWCELDMISALYKKAKETDADIVACDYFENTKGKETYIKQNYEGLSPQEVVRGFFNGNIHSSLWNKLIKRSLYTANTIYPPTEISWLEDMRDNSGSILHTITIKHIEELKFLANTTKSFLEDQQVYHRYKKEFLCFVLSKMMGLSHLISKPFTAYIDDVMPDANKLKYIVFSPHLSFLSKIKQSLIFFGFHKIISFLLIIDKNTFKKNEK